MKFDYKRKSNDDWEDFVMTAKRIEKFVKDPKGRLILDAGCGQRIPQTLLLHNFGYRVIGIDLRIPERYKTLKKAHFPLNIRLRLGRIKRLIRECYQLENYYGELESLCGKQLSFKGLDVRVMDIVHTEFPNGYFDVIVSNAVFEHLPDVDAACRELKRVTKKGGYLFIGIHLFTGISGGHHDEWQDPALVMKFTVPPWDHLRGKLYQVDSTLNRFRFRDYRRIFERYFDIIDLVWGTSQVEASRRFLTPQIRKELGDYSEEELLKHSVSAILRN